MSLAAASATLPDALIVLRERLVATSLELALPGTEAVRRERAELVGQIDDYLLPRVREMDAPLLAVVGGSTGAGKSTLVNSLVGSAVSAAGVLRPTTRVPVLVCNPADAGWFLDERIFPAMPRQVDDASPAGRAALRVRLVADVPPGLALVDAPDIDSVVSENRELASHLLAAADLWIFVTTAARYSDAIPWELLRSAKARSAALAVVLDRVPPEAVEEVSAHLREMLRREGLADAPLFTILETETPGAILPPGSIAALREWLDALAADAEARGRVIRTTLQGALDTLASRVEPVVRQLRLQAETAEQLEADAARAYERSRLEMEDAVERGRVLRGEVLARWNELVAGDQILRALERGLGRLRDRVIEALTGRPSTEREVRAAIEGSLVTLIVDTADRAAGRAIESWEADPAGRALLGDLGRRLGRVSEGFRFAADSEVRGWQGHVMELVRQQGAAKRAQGRALSFGVNAIGVALMVALFAHTGGLTGGEIAIAGGTASVSQKLLEALFGDQAVRLLADGARSDLFARVDRLFGSEARRFEELVEAIRPPAGEVARLESAVRAVQAAR